MIPLGSLIPTVILLAMGAAVALGTIGGAGGLSDFIATIKGRGARVGAATHVNGNGVIPDDPEMLAAGAGLDLTTYALARMISSEEGNSDPAYKVAVGFAAWNLHGQAIASALTAGKGDADEHFKAQGYRYTAGPGKTAQAGGYASTAQDPREDDVKIAQAIIAGTIADTTGGATNFFRPGLQDDQFARGEVSRDGAAVIAEWTGGGLAQIDVPGVDPAELAFFKKGGPA